MKYKLKRFLIIVVASFLIFLLFISGGTYYFLNKINNTDDIGNVPGEVGEFQPPDAKDETIINTLLMGIDKSKALADVMILVSYNKKNGKISMVSIPRDTYVNVTGVKHHKINSIYGVGNSGAYIAMDTVSNIFQVPVHYYATVDFKGVEKIIDIIGGVKVNVPLNMDYEDPTQDLYIHLKKGERVLDGKDSLKFLRYRSGYADADLGRIKAQQKFIQAFIGKLNSPKIIPKAFVLLNEMSESIKTNMPEGDIAAYALKAVGIKMENVNLHTLPGEAKTINGGSYYVIDDVKLLELKDEINKELETEGELGSLQTMVTGVSKNLLVNNETLRNNITVEILNSTGKDGLAGTMKRDLEAKGYKVARAGFMKELTFNTSRIIDRRGDKDALTLISKDTGITLVESDIDENYNCHITIIIGKDKLNGGI